MRTELTHLHERLGGTFVYVTHDQAEAMTMADRIVVMNGGRIEQLGGPLDIYRKRHLRRRRQSHTLDWWRRFRWSPNRPEYYARFGT